MVDIFGFQLAPEYPLRSAFETMVLLNKELELYNPDLLKKPSLLIVNKMDLPDSSEKLSEFMSLINNDDRYEEGLLNIEENMIPQKRIEFREIFSLSASKDMKSVEKVKQKIREHLDEIEDDQENFQEKVKSLTLTVDAKIHTDSNKKVLM